MELGEGKSWLHLLRERKKEEREKEFM